MSDSTSEEEVKCSDHHHKESHGVRDDIDEKTPLENVKAPTVFERAKEEFEALLQTINAKNQSSNHGTRENNENESHKVEKLYDKIKLDSEVKTPKNIDRAKEKFLKLKHDEKSSPRHKETHGRSNDIDETTPIGEIKAPNIFERAKEEFEAVLTAICSKKDE